MAPLLIVGLLALQAPAAPARDAAPRPAETYTIRGRVTDVTSGQPIRGVAVSIHAANEGRSQAQGALTDDEGRWGFTGLAAGDYILNHGKPGFTRVEGVRIHSPVHVSAQFPMRDIELVLARGGVITGRVTDPMGEPAVGIQVQANRVWQGRVT
jgi:protocatechuate 3,4-dioxygenase beta subunit